MTRMRVRLLFAALLPFALGCSGGSSVAPADAAADTAGGPCVPDPTFMSDCGKPCDPGNSIGVGKFCKVTSDCHGNLGAYLCTTINDSRNFFCTLACRADAGPDDC